jgi:glutaredoxin 3
MDGKVGRAPGPGIGHVARRFRRSDSQNPFEEARWALPRGSYRITEMTRVTIYTTALCPYCHAAKRLLSEKGVSYDEIDVTFKPSERAAMTARAGGRRTVPQIFVGETHVGGCDDLYAIEQDGELDMLLAR